MPIGSRSELQRESFGRATAGRDQRSAAFRWFLPRALEACRFPCQGRMVPNALFIRGQRRRRAWIAHTILSHRSKRSPAAYLSQPLWAQSRLARQGAPARPGADPFLAPWFRWFPGANLCGRTSNRLLRHFACKQLCRGCTRGVAQKRAFERPLGCGGRFAWGGTAGRMSSALRGAPLRPSMDMVSLTVRASAR